MEQTKTSEDISFQMLSAIDEANSLYLQAMQSARQSDFDKASNFLDAGDIAWDKARDGHTRLLHLKADGEFDRVDFFALHAEDRLTCGETYKLMAHESVHVYRAIAAIS
ncbi:MAG: PTS lactose/cellobiose transporter subunit IIA [Selenomonadaceae bacterium]